MKKVICISLVFFCFSVFHTDHAFGQQADTAVVKHEASEEVDGQDANAQKTIVCNAPHHTALGIEGGLNIAYLTTGMNTGNENTGNAIIAARFGMVLDIPLVARLYLQPGFFYAMNGGNVSINNEWNVNALEVPVNLVCKFRLAEGNYFFVGLGPYVGYNLSGTRTGGTLNIGTSESDDMRPLDLGVGVNVGCELRSGFFVRIRYQEGFSNLQPGSEFATINSSSFGLQVGYFFGRDAGLPAPPPPSQEYPEQRIWDM